MAPRSSLFFHLRLRISFFYRHLLEFTRLTDRDIPTTGMRTTPLAMGSQRCGRRFDMRLQALYFIGALAVTAIPLSAGAQSLPANDQPVPNAEVYARSAEACPAGSIWEPAGYLSSGKWRPAHCAPRDTITP